MGTAVRGLCFGLEGGGQFVEGQVEYWIEGKGGQAWPREWKGATGQADWPTFVFPSEVPSKKLRRAQVFFHLLGALPYSQIMFASSPYGPDLVQGHSVEVATLTLSAHT